MGHLVKASRLPLRIRLTLVLVLLVSGVAAIIGASSYRILYRYMEQDAIDALDASTKAMSISAKSAIEFKYDRLKSELKAVELGCGVSGVMVPNCAREMLRKFVQTEHGRGASLQYDGRRRVTVGKVVNGSDDPSAPVFRVNEAGEPFFWAQMKDDESGLKLTADFNAQYVIPAQPHGSSNSGFVIGAGSEPVDRVVAVGDVNRQLLIGSGLTRGCFQGLETSATMVDEGGEKHYVSFEPIADVPNVCAVASLPQALVLAPALRWRSKLKTIVLVAAVCGAVIAYLLALLLTRPLTRLQKRVIRFRHGDYDSPIPQVGSGEILELSRALALMAESINASRSALIDSENRLRLAYKAARLWMWEHNLATGMIHWRSPDPNAPTQHGNFRSLLRSVNPEDRRALCNAVRGAKLTGTYEVEYRVNDEHGDTSWISSWGQVLESRSGKPRTMVGVSLDTTVRKQAEASLIEQEKLTATAQISATLAHEINNPLTSVISAIYMARGVADVPEAAQRFLQIAQQESKRLAQIGRQMLALHRKPGTAEVVDLKFLWEDVLLARGTDIARKHLSIERKLESVKVFGFKDELRHAFASLLLNAVESAPNGGTIAVRVRNSRSFSQFGERGARVMIADNGPGIACDKLPAVFEPFVGTKKVAGTGLGLWATRAAVLKHGGRVRLRTTTTGPTGTFVSIFLPARCSNN
jgi:signal transduction histidine kinase/HAMP domain-containing protein